MKKISVLTHLFYEDTWCDLKDYLLHLNGHDTHYYFNLCSDQVYTQRLNTQIKSELANSTFIKTPNVGKDIGGKLALINLLLLLDDNSDYLLLLHDKKSPHINTGIEWRNKLLSIAAKENCQSVFSEFEKNKKVGLIATDKFIIDEYNEETGEFNCTSNIILKELKRTLKLRNKEHNFVGGTMFWVRSEIYRKFFKKHSPIAIRAMLERGNILDHEMGSLAHAWERVLSWIVLSEGYLIKGLKC